MLKFLENLWPFEYKYILVCREFYTAKYDFTEKKKYNDIKYIDSYAAHLINNGYTSQGLLFSYTDKIKEAGLLSYQDMLKIKSRLPENTDKRHYFFLERINYRGFFRRIQWPFVRKYYIMYDDCYVTNAYLTRENKKNGYKKKYLLDYSTDKRNRTFYPWEYVADVVDTMKNWEDKNRVKGKSEIFFKGFFKEKEN